MSWPRWSVPFHLMSTHTWSLTRTVYYAPNILSGDSEPGLIIASCELLTIVTQADVSGTTGAIPYTIFNLDDKLSVAQLELLGSSGCWECLTRRQEHSAGRVNKSVSERALDVQAVRRGRHGQPSRRRQESLLSHREKRTWRVSEGSRFFPLPILFARQYK